MVTASDGSPSPVTRKPLTAPSTAPISTHSGMIVWMARSWFHRKPMSALVRPSVLATDRSISPVITMNVIGRATSAIGSRSSTRKVKLRLVPKLSTLADATISTSTASRMMMVSQLASLRLISNMGISLPQTAGDAYGDDAVGADGQQDQRPVDRLLPELVDVQHREGAADDRQQQRAEPRAPHRAAAAEHRAPAAPARGHHVQLVPGPGRRVHRAEPGREQAPGQTREGAAEQ